MNTAPGTPVFQHESLECLLVGIPSDQERVDTPALKIAIELARQHQAAVSLFVFAPGLLEPFPLSSTSASRWLVEETERLEKLTSAAAHSATAISSSAGLDVVAEHPHSPFEPRSERFVKLARVHDLTVLDAVDISNTSQRAVIEDVLFDSGHALLLVPRQGGTAKPRRIAIAWDGSARAARAVKDALPLLGAADSIVAVTVEGEKDLSGMAPGANLATYLARHGIDCKLATLAAQARDVAERLRLFVAEEDIEMVLMGAFVHSRFRQDILGGVTQSLLDQPPVPLFLAH